MNNEKLSEEEYIAYLGAERHLFAWALQHFGRICKETAEKEAHRIYPYEPESDEYRWLIFHDEAYHRAMLYLYGNEYWREFPQYATPSQEYLDMEDWVRENNIRL